MQPPGAKEDPRLPDALTDSVDVSGHIQLTDTRFQFHNHIDQRLPQHRDWCIRAVASLTQSTPQRVMEIPNDKPSTEDDHPTYSDIDRQNSVTRKAFSATYHEGVGQREPLRRRA